jgi:hypothetical protein
MIGRRGISCGLVDPNDRALVRGSPERDALQARKDSGHLDFQLKEGLTKAIAYFEGLLLHGSIAKKLSS